MNKHNYTRQPRVPYSDSNNGQNGSNYELGRQAHSLNNNLEILRCNTGHYPLSNQDLTATDGDNHAFTIYANKSYHKGLSKLNSGLPSRHTLAFFVPNICLASQAKHDTSTTPICPPRGRTVYDGVTSQNKIAFGRICGAASVKAESEPRHPIPIASNRTYSVTPTQNLTGGYHA